MMGEFAEMGDWDLQAIVRGYCTSTDHEFSSPTSLMDMKGVDPPLMGFATTYTPPSTHYHLTNAFPDDLFETATVLDELQQLYKPFYPISPHERPASSPSLHVSGDFERETVVIDHHDQEDNKQPLATPTPNPNPTPASAATTGTAAPTKHKRRKNQQKRVVLNVTADGLSSDLWAWRKYGQKPIKGSPYPRSYYRCSSMKGCLARKQVERSNSDPTMFIVTYTAEHSHSQPTRRNSLAGTTRNKFSSCRSKTSPAATTTVAHDSDTLTPKHSTTSSSSSSSVSAAADHPSPITTPLSETTHHQPIKDYHEDEEPQLLDPFMDMDMDTDPYMDMDMGMISDDFFAGLEELDAMVSACPNQFPLAFSC